LVNVKVNDNPLEFHRPLGAQPAPLVEVWPEVAQIHVTWSPALIVTKEGVNDKVPLVATITVAVAAKAAVAHRHKNKAAMKAQHVAFMTREERRLVQACSAAQLAVYHDLARLANA
jgi:hypothetical protein